MLRNIMMDDDDDVLELTSLRLSFSWKTIILIKILVGKLIF